MSTEQEDPSRFVYFFEIILPGTRFDGIVVKSHGCLDCLGDYTTLSRLCIYNVYVYVYIYMHLN